MSKNLKKVLKKIVSKDLNEKLAVADAKLGNSIKVKSFKLLFIEFILVYFCPTWCVLIMYFIFSLEEIES